MSVFEKHPKTTLSVLFIVFLITIDIAAAALFSSIGLYKPQFKIERYYRVQNETYHHTLASNISHSEAKWGALGYSVNTNSLGFKDNLARTVPLKKTNPRILLIGDSFTEGIGYAHNDTFAGILENKLKIKNIDVFNAGVSSYSPIIYLRKVQYLIDKGFEFDHLAVFIDISDIEDEIKNYTFDKDNNVINRPNSKSNKLNERLKRFIAENTIILSNLRILIRKLKNKDVKPRTFDNALNRTRGLWTINESLYNDYGKDGLALADKHMTMLANLLKTKNIKLSILVYPWPDQIFKKDLDSKQVSYWKKWASNKEVDFINLFPIFINKTSPKNIIENYFILGDVHWNKKGHEHIAKSVLPHLYGN